MILTVAVALWSVGFVTWLVSTVMGFHGVGAVGAVIFLGVSAATVQYGLEYRVGYTETAGNEATEVVYDHEPVQTSDSFPLSMLSVLLGSVMFLRSLVEAAHDGLENGFGGGEGGGDEPSEDDVAGGIFRA